MESEDDYLIATYLYNEIIKFLNASKELLSKTNPRYYDIDNETFRSFMPTFEMDINSIDKLMKSFFTVI
jgi:hypothetical protein